jgi:hypothetical protein
MGTVTGKDGKPITKGVNVSCKGITGSITSGTAAINNQKVDVTKTDGKKVSGFSPDKCTTLATMGTVTGKDGKEIKAGTRVTCKTTLSGTVVGTASINNQKVDVTKDDGKKKTGFTPNTCSTFGGTGVVDTSNQMAVQVKISKSSIILPSVKKELENLSGSKLLHAYDTNMVDVLATSGGALYGGEEEQYGGGVLDPTLKLVFAGTFDRANFKTAIDNSAKTGALKTLRVTPTVNIAEIPVPKVSSGVFGSDGISITTGTRVLCKGTLSNKTGTATITAAGKVNVTSDTGSITSNFSPNKCNKVVPTTPGPPPPPYVPPPYNPDVTPPVIYNPNVPYVPPTGEPPPGFVDVPIVDEQGEPVLDEGGEPQVKRNPGPVPYNPNVPYVPPSGEPPKGSVDVPIVDEQGEPVLDEQGEPQVKRIKVSTTGTGTRPGTGTGTGTRPGTGTGTRPGEGSGDGFGDGEGSGEGSDEMTCGIGPGSGTLFEPTKNYPNPVKIQVTQIPSSAELRKPGDIPDAIDSSHGFEFVYFQAPGGQFYCITGDNEDDIEAKARKISGTVSIALTSQTMPVILGNEEEIAQDAMSAYTKLKSTLKSSLPNADDSMRPLVTNSISRIESVQGAIMNQISRVSADSSSIPASGGGRRRKSRRNKRTVKNNGKSKSYKRRR